MASYQIGKMVWSPGAKKLIEEMWRNTTPEQMLQVIMPEFEKAMAKYEKDEEEFYARMGLPVPDWEDY